MSRFTLVVGGLLILTAAAPMADQRPRQRPQLRAQATLQPGMPAPDFTLAPRGGGVPITLSSFRERMPVALVFGSYT